MNESISYRLIRSSRKTLALEITPEGEALVRAPARLPINEIERFVLAHSEWIKAHRARRLSEAAAEVTPEKRREYIDDALRTLPPRVEKYARLLDVKPLRVTITNAHARFGSCSDKNAICFSWRLMRYPDEAIDYVVAHELAHIRHHDHSKAFYALLASVMPDHKTRRALLRLPPTR